MKGLDAFNLVPQQGGGYVFLSAPNILRWLGSNCLAGNGDGLQGRDRRVARMS